MLKRLFDLVIALFASIMLAPVFLVIALWIKLDSSGPIFYRQTRIGQFCKPFCIYKFRTMRSDSAGLPITVGADSRITHSGIFLRRYKLDELPQLFNVVRGDMSLVGPRPEVPKYVAYYPEEDKKLILSIRPGITDQASILFRDENKQLATADDPEKLYLDKILPIKIHYYREYVLNRSFLGDICIMAATFKAIFL